jgi:hypothetical protein
MALKDLIKPAPTPAAERPPGITCEKYVRGEGKRCVHYVANGACALPDDFMCVEWLKANGPKPARDGVRSLPIVTETETPKPEPRLAARDLFGNQIPEVEQPAPTLKPAPLPRTASDAAPAIDVDQLRGFTTEDIESFKALGLEVQLHSETYGELWLVPAYTGQPRKEITPEHAATLMRVLSVFPGSHIVAFEKTPNHERPERPEKRS